MPRTLTAATTETEPEQNEQADVLPFPETLETVAAESDQPVDEAAAAVDDSAPETVGDAQPPQPVPAEPKPRPVTQASELDILTARLMNARSRVCSAVVAEMQAKAAFEICKGERVAASEALLEAENDMRNFRADQYEFAGAQVGSASSEGDAAADRSTETEADESASDYDPSDPPHWRNILLSAMGVTPGIPAGTITKLAEKGIKTVGDLSDWTSDGRDLHDIPGVGKAKAEKIIDALAAFWELHPEASEETESADMTEAAEVLPVEEAETEAADQTPIDVSKALAEI